MFEFVLQLVIATLLCSIASAQRGNTFYGVDYGINIYGCPSYETMRNDFSILKRYTNRVRMFGLGLCNQGEFAVRATQELGMRLYLTLWVDQNQGTFESEFRVLQSLLRRYNLHQNVDGIIVGSEVLYRGDAPLWLLLQYIDRVKEIADGVPVTTADTFNMISPELAAPLDFVMINIFSYWEGVHIDQAVDKFMQHYYETVNLIGGNKVVKVSETGWPSDGQNFGAAVASPENQSRYLREILCRTRREGIDLLWFSAIDEPYKRDVEGFFGVLDWATRSLKPNHNLQKMNTC
ncbi:glycoside hydrolase superfamily, partial [Fennellomyces sp. T-0311]